MLSFCLTVECRYWAENLLQKIKYWIFLNHRKIKTDLSTTATKRKKRPPPKKKQRSKKNTTNKQANKQTNKQKPKKQNKLKKQKDFSTLNGHLLAITVKYSMTFIEVLTKIIHCYLVCWMDGFAASFYYKLLFLGSVCLFKDIKTSLGYLMPKPSL